MDKNSTNITTSITKVYRGFHALQPATASVKGSLPEVTVIVIEMGSVGIVVGSLVIIFLLFRQFAKFFQTTAHPGVRVTLRVISSFLARLKLLGDFAKIQLKIIGQKFYKPCQLISVQSFDHTYAQFPCSHGCHGGDRCRGYRKC